MSKQLDIPNNRRIFLRTLATTCLFLGGAACRSYAWSATSNSIDINNLIKEEISSGSNPINIPAGTYTLKEPIIIDKSNIHLVFDANAVIRLERSFNSAISIKSASGVKIEGGTILADNCTGAAIDIDNCSSTSISNVTISQFSAIGIKISDSKLCQITFCHFTKALVDSRWQAASSTDILVDGTNDTISIANGSHRSGGAYGISIRTEKSGQTSRNHSVMGNNISGYNSYGIMLYRNGPYHTGDNQLLEKITVQRNLISEISGDRAANPKNPDSLTFGSGIYIQGAEDCVISNNIISKTNENTNSELLAPGAIGIANTGSCEVMTNTISDSIHAVFINDSLHKGRQNGDIKVIGNKITRTKKSPIKIVVRDNVTVRDNYYFDSGSPDVELSSGHNNEPPNHLTILNNKSSRS